MSENERRDLQLIDLAKKLPVGFEKMSKEDQLELIKKMSVQEIEIRGELQRKVGKSRLAEADLEHLIDLLQRLQVERKAYTAEAKGETGSGTYHFHVRGGDTKFIIPVLVVVAVLILGIVLIFALG